MQSKKAIIRLLWEELITGQNSTSVENLKSARAYHISGVLRGLFLGNIITLKEHAKYDKLMWAKYKKLNSEENKDAKKRN